MQKIVTFRRLERFYYYVKKIILDNEFTTNSALRDHERRIKNLEESITALQVSKKQ